MNKKLTVLFISHYSGFYGANRSLLQLIKELRKSYDITPIVLVPSYGEFCLQLEKEQISYFKARYYSWEYNRYRFKGLLKCGCNLFLYAYIYLKVRSLKIDLLHSNSSVMALGAFLKWILGKPHIWHLREFGYEDYGLRYTLGIRFSALIFRKGSDLLIAVSEVLRDHYARQLQTARISVIYNGISFPNLTIYNEKKMEEDIRFCCLGYLSPQKNQMAIIKAIDYLVHVKRMQGFKVYIVGNGEPHYTYQLKSYVAEKKLAKYCDFCDYKSDVSSFLQDMHIGIVPSCKEAFGRVCVEYMLNKMPVIAAAAGALPEIVRDKETGILYERSNYISLSTSMELFLEHKELIKEYGNKGYERAIKCFSAERNAHRIYTAYKEIVKE